MNIVNVAQMGKPIFDNLFGMFFGASTKVGFMDASGNPILGTVSIIRIQHKNEKKGAEYPLETGESIAPHFVTQPKEVSLDCIVPIEDVAELKRYFETSEPITLITTMDSFENMIISSAPYVEGDNGMMDSVSVVILLKEVIFISVKYAKAKPIVMTKKGKHAKKVGVGKKMATDITATKKGSQTLALQLLGGFFK